MTRLRTIRSRGALAVIAALLVVPAAFAMHAFPDDETTDASRDNVFVQSKQNEPAVAIDPSNPMNVVAGANDEIDLESCNVLTDNTCPFTPGVGLTGVSFSTNGGVTFQQPTYTGYSTRHCLGMPFLDTDDCTPNPSGPIGTLPWYFENGLVSDGDPIAAFGPRPGANGQFSWTNGSRLYFINLTSNFADTRDEATFKGVEAIAVSRTDNVPLAATGGTTGKAAWMNPVIISRRLSTVTFSDKEQIWADNAASSPYFGNAYACWVSFRSNGGAPEPVMFSRSTDGGNTWSAPDQLSPAANTGLGQGRQGCTVRTGSDGVVYVFWEGAFQKKENAPFFSSAQLMARSFDGGDSFERPRAVVPVTDCGRFDPAQGRYTFDGVAGARTNSFPMVDIANGAPSGPGPNTIVMTFCDGLTSTTASNEQAPVWYSTDRGETWRQLTANAAQAGDRPDFPAIAISPDGTDVYVAYDA
ncbi:MAG: exo-alpha-sialidase, partial [Actinobacteria bacterium]|nr:exo-alpha-sialidase [Actinomycetota bacterium]